MRSRQAARWNPLRRLDVIGKTQLRLTLQYSVLLILVLSLFAVIACSLVYVSVTKSQKDKLSAMLDDEFSFVAEQSTQLHEERWNEADFSLAIGADQAFYYWVDAGGKLLAGDESQSVLRKQALKFISRGERGESDIRILKMQTEERMWNGRGGIQTASADTPFLVGSRTLYSGDRIVGTLYIGMDISSTQELFERLIMVLIIVLIMFFAVALYVSHLMAGRAMIPIAESLRRQREFVADASHELRTPLSVLLSSVEALHMEDHIAEDPFTKRTLGHMKEEVKGMTRLVSDLLALARSDSGHVELQEAWFDSRASAEKTIQGLAPLLEAKQMRLVLNSPEQLMVRGDEQRLMQLLVILIDNAVKYSPAGETVTVSLSGERSHKQPVFVMSVKDNGIGIKPEDHAKIFDRFYREDKARSRQLGGHGLGLAIAKWIADACGGTIQVASAPGAGSTFTVRIPFHP